MTSRLGITGFHRLLQSLRENPQQKQNGPVRFGRPFNQAIKSSRSLGVAPSSGRLRLTLIGYGAEVGVRVIHSCAVSVFAVTVTVLPSESSSESVAFTLLTCEKQLLPVVRSPQIWASNWH